MQQKWAHYRNVLALKKIKNTDCCQTTNMSPLGKSLSSIAECLQNNLNSLIAVSNYSFKSTIEKLQC